MIRTGRTQEMKEKAVHRWLLIWPVLKDAAGDHPSQPELYHFFCRTAALHFQRDFDNCKHQKMNSEIIGSIVSSSHLGDDDTSTSSELTWDDNVWAKQNQKQRTDRHRLQSTRRFHDPFQQSMLDESVILENIRRSMMNSESASSQKTKRERNDHVDSRFDKTPDGSPLSQARCSPPSTPTLLPTMENDLDVPPLKQDCGDLLAEGIEHLSMAMLVNIYGKLRELSLLGHVSVKLRDIDVNSHQYNSRKKQLQRLGCWTAADEAKGYLDTTRKAAFIVRTIMDEHELFETEYARGAGSDIKRALLQYDASLLTDFSTWVEESRKKQLDTATNAIIARIYEEYSQHQMTRANRSFHIARRRRSLLNARESFQEAHWLQQERKLIEDHFGVKNDLPPSRRQTNSQDRSPSQLSRSQISKAIEESSAIFFEKGSVMRNLLESGFEVVWFADRHPSDIIYGICVNRQTMTITVVFRGQEGIFGLLRKRSMSTFENPISHENYDGNSETINLRSVVADELLRVRMDTQMSLISEIREKIAIIGQELTGGGVYHVSVVGHSRGGCYATILGYYLASEMHYLKLASAIRVFNFASSPVGCASFQAGFKHLEEEGRLMHARFANSDDPFSSLPLKGYCEETNSKLKYQHVGMQVRLHKAGIKQSLDVCYDVKESPLMEFAQVTRNILSWIKGILFISHNYSKNHSISQYHLRMHFAREYRYALGDAGDLRFGRKRKSLKSLNEYYEMKCHRLHDYVGFSLDDRSNHVPSSWVMYVLVACLLIEVLFEYNALS